MDFPAYLTLIAEQFANELRPILALKQVTANTELLGAYTEVAVRNLAVRAVKPMGVCTGAVLDFPLPDKLQQIDLIVWAPFPLPGVFETQGFGLIPRSSAFGVIEVKRTNYSGTDAEIEKFVEGAPSLVCEPSGAIAAHTVIYGIGVIGALTSAPSARLRELIKQKKAVALFDATDGEPTVRPMDILTLLNFLYSCSWRYHMQNAQPSYPQIATEIHGLSSDH